LPFAVSMRAMAPVTALSGPARGMDPARPIHISVMLDEVLAGLEPRAGQTFVDGTLGAGGHTRALAEKVGPSGLVIALDRDARALDAAEQNLAGLPVKIAAANFCELGEVLEQVDVARVDGILLDLGLSSDQLADSERGFSFDATGELDLRFDTESGEPAWRLLERLSAAELADLIYQLGEERHSRRIARAIVERRMTQPIRTAKELADLVRSNVPRSAHARRNEPATRTFQALRIAVNDELGSLRRALAEFPKYLSPGGRLAVISFHSLEDRIVKEAFRDDPRWEIVTRKPLRPSELEVLRNPRARSAKLRVARRA
jgi:16S rRNA (cytosine1402-N4)-methyltransferase